MYKIYTKKLASINVSCQKFIIPGGKWSKVVTLKVLSIGLTGLLKSAVKLLNIDRHRAACVFLQTHNSN